MRQAKRVQPHYDPMMDPDLSPDERRRLKAEMEHWDEIGVHDWQQQARYGNRFWDQ